MRHALVAFLVMAGMVVWGLVFAWVAKFYLE